MRIVVLFLCVLCAVPAFAEQTGVGFDLRLLGFKLGEVKMQRGRSGRTYAANAQFQTTGAVGVLARVHFDIEARGRLNGHVPFSNYYAEDMDTGRRQSKAQITFKTKDTRLDPMSALYAGLGDRTVKQGCAMDRSIFDGTRTHRLVIAPKGWQDNVLTCTGRYYRIAGYTPEELAGHKGYYFVVSYRRQDGMLYAMTAHSDTHYGRVRLDRQ